MTAKRIAVELPREFRSCRRQLASLGSLLIGVAQTQQLRLFKGDTQEFEPHGKASGREPCWHRQRRKASDRTQVSIVTQGVGIGRFRVGEYVSCDRSNLMIKRGIDERIESVVGQHC